MGIHIYSGECNNCCSNSSVIDFSVAIFFKVLLLLERFVTPAIEDREKVYSISSRIYIFKNLN